MSSYVTTWKLTPVLTSLVVGMFLSGCVSVSGTCPHFPPIPVSVSEDLLTLPQDHELDLWLNDLHKLKLKLERCND